MAGWPDSLLPDSSGLHPLFSPQKLQTGLWAVKDIQRYLRQKSMTLSSKLRDEVGECDRYERFVRKGIDRGKRVRKLVRIIENSRMRTRKSVAHELVMLMKGIAYGQRMIRVPGAVYFEECFEFDFDVSLSEIHGSPFKLKNSQGKTIEFHPGGSRLLDDYSEMQQSGAKLSLLASNHDFRKLDEKKPRRGSEGQPEIIEEKYKQNNKREPSQVKRDVKDAKIKEIRSTQKPKEILDPAFNKYADPVSPQKATFSKTGEYASYWLTCIESALNADDALQIESIGYVTVFKTSFEPTDKEVVSFM